MQKNVFFLLLVFMSLAACNPLDSWQNIKTPKYQPGVAFPLINTDFTIREVLGKFNDGRYIDTLADGTIAVVYRGKAISVGGEDVYTFPAITNVPIPLNNTTVPFNTLLGQDFKKIIFKTGNIVLKVNNTPNLFANDVTCKVTFSNFKLNGQALTSSFTIPKNTGTAATTITQNISTAGATLDLSSGDINISYTINNQNTPFTGGNLSFSLENMQYSYIEGKIPQYTFDLDETIIDLDIFKYWKLGDIYFKDPRINLIVANSYGVPLRAQANILNAIASNGVKTAITNTSYPNNIFNFPYPTISQAGTYALDTFKFNGTNSNLGQIIQQHPPQVEYQVSADLNTDGVQGFIMDSSKFDIYLDIALPMYGHASNYTLTKDFETDMSVFSAMDYAKFKLVTENGFPADIKLQILFLDESGKTLDSLFSGNSVILQAAEVDGNGRVNQANKATKITESEFSSARFSAIKAAKKLRLIGGVSTLNNGTVDVRFYTDYAMGLRLGIVAGVNPLDIKR